MHRGIMTNPQPKKKPGPKPSGTPEERAARRAQQIRDCQTRRRQKFVGQVVQLSVEEDAQLARIAADYPGGKKGWIEAVLRAELARQSTQK